MFGRSSFPAQEPARDLTDRIHFFVVKNRQREEIRILRLVTGSGSGQNDCVAVANQYGTACLFGHFTVFNSERTAVKIPAFLVLLHLFPTYSYNIYLLNFQRFISYHKYL